MLFKAAKLVPDNTVVEWPAQRIEICVIEGQPSWCRGMVSLLAK